MFDIKSAQNRKQKNKNSSNNKNLYKLRICVEFGVRLNVIS